MNDSVFKIEIAKSVRIPLAFHFIRLMEEL